MKRARESDLVRQVIDYLSLRGIFCWRNNTGSFRGTYQRKDGSTRSRFIRFGAVGSPDVIGIVDGMFLGVECKRKGGKQSVGQIAFEQAVRRAGGVYLLVSSLDELIEELTALEL